MILPKDMVFIYKDVMGMREKKTERKRETKEKIPVGCLPILLSTMWRPTVFRLPRISKTSRADPKWERVPNQMGKKKKGRGGRGKRR